MKKNLIPFLATVLIFTLTACASKSSETSADQSEARRSSETARAQLEEELFSESSKKSAEKTSDDASDEIFDDTSNDFSNNTFEKISDETAAFQTCTYDNVTFSVDASMQPQPGEEGIFLSSDQLYAYQVQAVTPLGDFTPQEFFDALIETYERKYDIISTDSAVSAYTSPDNVDCWLGNIKMLVNSTFFDIDVLIAPQKNTVASFAATCYKDNQDIVDIREVSSTATFQIGDADYVSGNSFIANDNSELCLYADGTFANYQSADDYDGDCLTGTYEVYYGQSAIDQVAELTDYGLTEDELNFALLAAQNGYILNSEHSMISFKDGEPSVTEYHVCLDTFYALILHNDQYISPNGESMAVGTTGLFIGYYIPELQMLDMTNANTASYAQFTYKEPANAPH